MCRPEWNCVWAPWLSSVVYIERMTAMSSTQLADVRQPVADLDAALAVLPEADLERIELVALLAVGVVDDGDAGQLQLLGVLHVLVGRLADRLAGVLGQLRLGVEGLQVQTPPFMNSQMTLFAFGAKCGLPSGGCQPGAASAAHDAVAGQHGPQGQAGEAHAQVGEERAAMDAARIEHDRLVISKSRRMSSPVSGW